VNVIKISLQDSNGKVKIQGQLTEAFGIERSLKQDDVLSTALFNVVLEKVSRNIETKPNGTVFNRTIQHIAYAVDMWIVGRSVRTMEEVVTE
jgi:glutaminase